MNQKEMSNKSIHKWIVNIPHLVMTYHSSKWCQIPYPNHSKGCPNYKREGCPPEAKHIRRILDLTCPIYFVHSEFDLQAHIERMKSRHPHWTERQLRNVLYWQGTSRKQLRKRVSIAENEKKTNITLYCPEAHGVNIYVTARKNGLKLERIRDLKTCRHVALLGYSKK